MSIEDKNVANLARDAADDLTDIAKAEIALARAEMRENTQSAVNGMRSLAMSLALLIPAITAGLAAIAYGLATIDGLSIWAGFAIVAILAAIIGFVMLQSGSAALKPENLSLTKTKENVQRDARTLKEAV